MNLKEAFRYQKFLDAMMSDASMAARSKDLCVDTVKVHHYNKADPNTEDVRETVERVRPYTADAVLKLIDCLIEEKYKLTHEIAVAKHNSGIDIDAMIERNKYRFSAVSAMRNMLRNGNAKRKETGRGFKFNVEGNQMGYIYDVDVEETEAYDRQAVKKAMSEYSAAADEASTVIDSAMVNTTVDYAPVYDVNDSFEDILAAFMTNS